MDDASKRELLVKEYLHIQSTIESFDSRALTVKAWSVTAGVAGLGTAFASDSKTVFLVAAFSSALFWALEASWKTFQVAYHTRNEALEAFFAGERDDLIPMQISRSWYSAWRYGGRRRFWGIMWWPHVFTPHLFVMLGGITLFGLSLVGLLEP